MLITQNDGINIFWILRWKNFLCGNIFHGFQCIVNLVIRWRWMDTCMPQSLCYGTKSNTIGQEAGCSPEPISPLPTIDLKSTAVQSSHCADWCIQQLRYPLPNTIWGYHRTLPW